MRVVDEASFRIRRAVAGDLDEVAAVWHDSAVRMDGAGEDTPEAHELRGRIDAELLSGWSLFVADGSGRIVGMLAIKVAKGLLDQLFVAPDMQSQGVGRGLLQEAMRAMPDGFVLRMAAGNMRARRFYLREGLILLRTGVHPRHGGPVEYHGWNIGL